MTTATVCSFASSNKTRDTLWKCLIRGWGGIRNQSLWLLVSAETGNLKTRKLSRLQPSSVLFSSGRLPILTGSTCPKQIACLVKQEEVSVLCSQPKHNHSDLKPPTKPGLQEIPKLWAGPSKGSSVWHLGLWTYISRKVYFLHPDFPSVICRLDPPPLPKI